MRRSMLKSKIHRATVTEANVDYEGSLTLDAGLLEAADILPFEEVHVWNVTRGTRFRTYAIAGRPVPASSARTAAPPTSPSPATASSWQPSPGSTTPRLGPSSRASFTSTTAIRFADRQPVLSPVSNREGSGISPEPSLRECMGIFLPQIHASINNLPTITSVGAALANIASFHQKSDTKSDTLSKI